MLTWITQHKWMTGGIVAAAAFTGFLVFGGNGTDSGIETVTVQEQDVRQTISETGTVSASNDVNLSFEITGRVEAVHVDDGDVVAAGDILAELAADDQQAAVAAARARLDDLRGDSRPVTQEVVETRIQAAETALDNAEDELDRVQAAQDRNVRDARETLLSNDLEAFFTGEARGSSGRSYTPPTITGTYTSDERGQYVIDPYQSGADSGYSFRYEWEGEGGSSRTGITTISTSAPQPLGDNGLYIEFPEDFARDSNVEWTVEVPNPRSDTYVSVRNAYESALDDRADAIAVAEEKVESAAVALAEARASGAQTTAPATDPRIRAAQAELRQAELALAKTQLTAPFSGTITDVEANVGELVSAGTPAASLVSSGYEITVDVPEADISRLDVGDRAAVTLDAYDDIELEAVVTDIAPAASSVEGVTVVEVTLQIEADEPTAERLKTGLSADLEIAADAASGVLAVPTRAVIETADDTYVRVVAGNPETVTLDDIDRRSVTTGLRGSDGYVAITSGLEAGDVVVTFLPEALRDELAARESAE